MINQEVLPSCSGCKWLKPGFGAKAPSWLDSSKCGRCGFHNFVVGEPRLHFCSQLTTASGEKHPIVEHKHIATDMMYVWIEIRFRVLASPELMHVHYELMQIAPLEKFAHLTTIEQSARYDKLYYPKWWKFSQEYGQAIESEQMVQFGSRLRRRRQCRDQK